MSLTGPEAEQGVYRPRSLFGSAANLYLIHIVNLALPLATIPFLARTLGPDAWGGVLAAQALGVWTAVVLDYGFTLSATREIARGPTPLLASVLVADVLSAKLVLIAASAVILLAAVAAIPIFQAEPLLAVLGWGAGVAQSVNPLWFFQGIQRLTLPSAAYVGARIAWVTSLFLLVRTPSDAKLVLATQTIATGAAACFSLWLQYHTVRWTSVSWTGAVRALRQGRSMFVYRAAASLYTVANPLIVGVFMPAAQIATYGAAERVARAGLSGFGPISQAVYPHVTYLATTDRNRAARVALKSFLALVGIGVAGATLGWFLAPTVVTALLGDRFTESVGVLRILLLSFPPIAASTVLGVQWMVPLGLDRAFTTIVVAAGLLNILLAFSLLPMFGIPAMAWSVAVTETFVAVAMAITLWRQGADPISVLMLSKRPADVSRATDR